MPKLKPTFENIRLAQEDVDDVKRRVLSANGWDHTSSLLGSRWMWTKNIKGYVYVVNTEDALFFEAQLQGE